MNSLTRAPAELIRPGRTPPPRQRSIADLVAFACKAADEAYAAGAEACEKEPEELGSATKLLLELKELDGEDTSNWNPPPTREERHAAGHAAAVDAFKGCMPPLTNRTAARGFVALVAVGVQRKYLTAEEAKTLLYTAQLALAAHSLRRK